MFLELIATFAAGAGAAGLVLVLNLMTGGRLPRWAMPVAAGLAMLGVAISNEASWGARTAQGLPEGLVVVDEWVVELRVPFVLLGLPQHEGFRIPPANQATVEGCGRVRRTRAAAQP